MAETGSNRSGKGTTRETKPVGGPESYFSFLYLAVASSEAEADSDSANDQTSITKAFDCRTL